MATNGGRSRRIRGGFALAVGVALALTAVPAGTPALGQDGPGAFQLTYPTAARPAAAQPEALFDVDVTTPEAGAVEGAFRPSDSGGDWEPLEVVTVTEVVEAGDVTATATVPESLATGTYDLRIRLLDAEGDVVGEDQAEGGLVVEDHGRLTGFETRTGTIPDLLLAELARTWTTHEEELAFLQDVVESSERAEVEVIGESVQGRPLHLVRLGYPTAPSVAEAAPGRSVLFVCTQHGNEPAPRESCLKEIRRLAFTADTRTRDYLAATPVFFVPTANPDGRELNVRGNADGLDLNRDHLRLATVEAQAMARAMRDVQPHLLADLHEYGTTSSSRPMFEWIWPRHLNVDTGVRALGVEWGREWLAPRLAAQGITNGEYTANPGTGENVTILNAAGLRHVVGVLTESRTSAVPGESPFTSHVQQRRVFSQDAAIHETLRFHRENAERIEQATRTAQEAKTDDGRYRRGPYFWYGNSEDLPDLPPDDAILTEPPCGYLLDGEQTEFLATWLDAYAVDTAGVGDRTYVPMGQAAQPVIGLMMDERARSNEVAAEPWPHPDDEPPPPDVACAADGPDLLQADSARR